MLPAYIFSKSQQVLVLQLAPPTPTVTYASARGRLFRVARPAMDSRLFNWGDGGSNPVPTLYTAECVLMDYFSRWPMARGPAGDCSSGIDALYELNGYAVLNHKVEEVEPFDADTISWALAKQLGSAFAERLLRNAPDEFRIELPLIATVLCDIERTSTPSYLP